MSLFYCDIESSGINPKFNKIITIQFQKINSLGFPTGELIILKEWESSEEKIVKQFYKILTQGNVFEFIPVMQNHLFDFGFLIEKFKKYIPEFDKEPLEFIFSRAIIDIRSTLIIANQMGFKGCGLDKMTTKQQDGSMIPLWYEEKRYDLIENYIKQETEAFLKALQIIIKHLSTLKEKLKNED
jgi:hypothetical protein